jgi:hypothetical protein
LSRTGEKDGFVTAGAGEQDGLQGAANHGERTFLTNLSFNLKTANPAVSWRGVGFEGKEA